MIIDWGKISLSMIEYNITQCIESRISFWHAINPVALLKEYIDESTMDLLINAIWVIKPDTIFSRKAITFKKILSDRG